MYPKKSGAAALMYVYALFSGMVFYAPVATLYRLERGLSFAQIGRIEAMSLAVSMLLEVPWGRAADAIGYKRTLVVSAVLLLISKIIFLEAYSVPMFVLERLVLAVAMSGTSGADIAYLSRAGADGRVFGLYQGFGYAGLLAVVCVFPFLGTDVYRESAFLTVVSHCVACAVVLFLPREREESNGKTPRLSFLAAVGKERESPAFLVFVLSAALIAAVNQIVTVFLVQLRYEEAGMEVLSFGRPFLLLSVSSLAASVLAAGRRRQYGMFVPLGAAALGIVMLAAGHNIPSAVGGAVLVRFGIMAFLPQAVSFEAERTAGNDQATRLSVYALMGEAVELMLTLILSGLADRHLHGTFVLAGAALAIGAAGVAYGYRTSVR